MWLNMGEIKFSQINFSCFNVGRWLPWFILPQSPNLIRDDISLIRENKIGFRMTEVGRHDAEVDKLISPDDDTKIFHGICTKVIKFRLARWMFKKFCLWDCMQNISKNLLMGLYLKCTMLTKTNFCFASILAAWLSGKTIICLPSNKHHFCWVILFHRQEKL